MKLRPTNGFRDYETLANWCKWWHMETPAESIFNSVSYTAEDIAMGFLLRMENTTWAVLECFIKNPSANKSDSNKALDLIIKRLLKDAKKLGITRLAGTSNNPAILERIQKHGFQVLADYQFVVKDL